MLSTLGMPIIFLLHALSLPPSYFQEGSRFSFFPSAHATDTLLTKSNLDWYPENSKQVAYDPLGPILRPEEEMQKQRFFPEQKQRIRDILFGTMGDHITALSQEEMIAKQILAQEKARKENALKQPIVITQAAPVQLATLSKRFTGSAGYSIQNMNTPKGTRPRRVNSQAGWHQSLSNDGVNAKNLSPQWNVNDDEVSALYRDAFTGLTVSGGSRKMFTSELANRKRGWEEITAPGYWPAIRWIDSDSNSSTSPADLISKDFIKQLSLLRAQSPEAAVIYGEVKNGFEVSFSDETIRPIYFNSRLVPSAPGQAATQIEEVSPDFYSPDGFIRFVALNVSPITPYHIFFQEKLADGSKSPIKGAFPFIARAGEVTELFLKDIQTRTFSGKVILGSDDHHDARPLAGAVVRVVGQDSQAGFTDANGNFAFYRVLVAGDHPFCAETERDSTQRVMVYPSKMENATLVRVSRRELKEFLYYTGGFSSEGGILAGSFFDLTHTFPLENFIPRIYSVSNIMVNLVPKIFTGSDSGEVNSDNDRVFAVNTQSATILELQSDRRKISKVIYPSPGVVNVEGDWDVAEAGY